MSLSVILQVSCGGTHYIHIMPTSSRVLSPTQRWGPSLCAFEKLILDTNPPEDRDFNNSITN